MLESASRSVVSDYCFQGILRFLNYLLLHVRSIFLNKPSVKDNESDKISSKFPWRLSTWIQVIVLQIHKTHIGQLCALFLFTVQNKGIHTYLTYFVNSFSLSCSCTAYLTGSKLQVNTCIQKSAFRFLKHF